MLFELCMFAIVLGLSLMVAQIMGGLLMLNIVMSKKFMKKYASKVGDLTNVFVEEFEEKTEL